MITGLLSFRSTPQSVHIGTPTQLNVLADQPRRSPAPSEPGLSCAQAIHRSPMQPELETLYRYPRSNEYPATLAMTHRLALRRSAPRGMGYGQR